MTDAWGTVDDNYDASTPPPHPAKFSDAVLDAIRECLNVVCEASPDLSPWCDYRVLDPFAGVGRVHELGQKSVGVEIEEEWARYHRQTIIGDSRYLPFPDKFFHGIITSPVYGNRMSDHHNAKDASKRITYRHKLGRELTPGNAGMLQWGKDYRDLHEQVWKECRRVTEDEGFFILNISDHIRAGEVVFVSDWHHDMIHALGYEMLHEVLVPTPRMRYGQNHDARVEHEYVWLFSLP